MPNVNVVIAQFFIDLMILMESSMVRMEIPDMTLSFFLSHWSLINDQQVSSMLVEKF